VFHKAVLPRTQTSDNSVLGRALALVTDSACTSIVIFAEPCRKSSCTFMLSPLLCKSVV
jgi:hypothetical protein